MYNVEYYVDEKGNCEIGEWIAELAEKAEKNKDARINKNKIASCIKALCQEGTRIGMPTVRQIEGDLWELRPLSNRIFFFYWKDDTFVLLHHFKKKTKKTPQREIDKAVKNMNDWKERR